MRELARVVRPGGTIAMLEFGLPRGLARPAWELYVRIGLPALGAIVSPGWRRVGSFLGPSIREFHARYDLRAVAERRDRGRPLQAALARRRPRALGTTLVSRPAFYALEPGGWRDYVTLLHLPYTAWHLSYVAIGAALAPEFAGRRLLAALAAFFLALGIGAHALDELNGRPLRTRIPTAS